MSNISIDKVSLKNLSESQFSIPNYQRNFIWNTQKQKKLIESVINEYPIGAILVYRSSSDQIIDGLQRVTTLKKFSENPKNIFKTASSFLELESTKGMIKNIKNSDVWNVIDNYTVLEEEIILVYKEWYNSLDKNGKAQNNSLKFSKNKKLQKLCGKYDLNDNDIIYIYACFNKSIDISYYQVPVMYYSGIDSKLPEIFENLNAYSVTLGKYDIYNSTWYHIKVPYNMEQIKIIDKIGNNNGKEEFIDNERPIMFMFKILHHDLSSIYGNSDGSNTPKSLYNLSFEIFSTLYSGNYNDIKSLVLYLEKHMSVQNQSNDRSIVSKFLTDISGIIRDEFQELLDELGKIILEKKNIVLYLMLIRIGKKYKIDFSRLTVFEREAKQQDKIITYSYNEIMEKNWFINENRQLSFFKEKCDEYEAKLNEFDKKGPNNISESGTIVVKPINTVTETDLQNCYTKRELENVCYIELQDTNNEPNNKRIQANRTVKESLEEKKMLTSIYKVSNAKFIKIVWKLDKEEQFNVINSKNISLKLNLQDFQHVLTYGLINYENSLMKYKADLSLITVD